MFKISHPILSTFCKKWKIHELSLFGSALRDDFNENSDIDFLVYFEKGAQWSLLDKVKMQQELATLLGRKVDLVNKKALENSHNPVRRQHILEHSQVIYVA